MKFYLNSISVLLGVVSVALAFPSKVTYDGVKVFRIDVGNSPEQVASIKDLVSKLGLALWTGKVVENTHVDLEVPKHQLSAFRKATKDFMVSVMHEDLGASIREESTRTETQCK